MNASLSPVLGRSLAVALLLAALGAAQAFVVGPVLDAHRAYGERIRTSGALVARYDALAKGEAEARSSLEEARRLYAASDVHLAGSSDALIAAELQQRLARVCGEEGCQIRSTQALPPTSEEGFVRIGLRVALAVRSEALHRMLHRLETAKPYLFVDALEIGAATDPVGGASPGAVQGWDLQARFELYGYRPEEGP